MDFIKGNNRDQLVFSTLEMQIEQDNPVRIMDTFVEHLDLGQLDFVVSTLKTEGRPAFELKLFLKHSPQNQVTQIYVVHKSIYKTNLIILLDLHFQSRKHQLIAIISFNKVHYSINYLSVLKISIERVEIANVFK